MAYRQNDLGNRLRVPATRLEACKEIAALVIFYGSAYRAAEPLGVSRMTLDRWIKAFPEISAAIDAATPKKG